MLCGHDQAVVLEMIGSHEYDESELRRVFEQLDQDHSGAVEVSELAMHKPCVCKLLFPGAACGAWRLQNLIPVKYAFNCCTELSPVWSTQGTVAATATVKNRSLADPGTPGTLRVQCRVCVSAE